MAHSEADHWSVTAIDAAGMVARLATMAARHGEAAITLPEDNDKRPFLEAAARDAHAQLVAGLNRNHSVKLPLAGLPAHLDSEPVVVENNSDVGDRSPREVMGGMSITGVLSFPDEMPPQTFVEMGAPKGLVILDATSLRALSPDEIDLAKSWETDFN